VIFKVDGFLMYYFVVVVDDYEMGIIYVVCGEEWISSMFKYVLLYIWFGLLLLKFVHMLLLCNVNKLKISKRKNFVVCFMWF